MHEQSDDAGDTKLWTCRLAVIKVASRCNLNCSYCYVYNLGDTSYLKQDRVMSAETAEALIDRAAEHCRRHRLREFAFTFHGGEPLLARPSYYRRFVDMVSAKFPNETTPLFSLQTNGMLLTRAWCDTLRDLNISIGISLDGPRRVNDAQRIDHAGRGSYQRVRRGWDLAVSCGLRPGLLTVMDVSASPREIFDHLKELAPRAVDFLFPDATHDNPPPHTSADGEATPYADWLLEIFQLWIADGASSFPIRLFERIIRMVLGGNGRLDALGPGRNEVLVIETDGSIEPVDVLKVCEDGITRTSLNVRDDSLDEAFADPMISLYYLSNERLCGLCEHCLVKEVCAGGYLPHRYRRRNGFDNPSVYCRDLMKLIIGIQNWVVANLPGDIRFEAGLTAASLAEARAAIAQARRHARRHHRPELTRVE